jgi:hypothetical protein
MVYRCIFGKSSPDRRYQCVAYLGENKVIEELALAGQATRPVSDANQELLAPYPDATGWRALLASTPEAATKRYSALLLQQAQASLRVEFNAVESMRSIRRFATRNQGACHDSVAQPGIAADRFAREIVRFLEALPSALAATECQAVVAWVVCAGCY